MPGGAGGALVYLINNTFYKDTLDEYTASRPAYLNIVIDSYDELFTDMKDSEQAHELEAINRLLEEYFSTTTGFLRKVSNNRYIAVIEERDLHPMIEGRFEILDKVRALLPSGMLTLSIGVGHGGKTLAECQEMARQSIDIALGRGGDQAAVKTADGFEFYGGVSHGVEKRSHVRSRIIANALADQIRQSDSVIIMGHRMSDLDAVGSAIGVLRMCKMCDVPAVIAVQQGATLAGALIDTFIDAGESHNFIEPRETLSLITPDTLLIVVDTYQKYLLESREIYEKCKRVVVIDHHRMAVGHIDNPVVISDFESNEKYLNKIELDLRVLYDFREELAGFSRMLDSTRALRRAVPLRVIKVWHRLFGRAERRLLTVCRPNLCLFNIYRIGYFMSNYK